MPITNSSTSIAFEYPFPEDRIFRYQAMQDVLSVLVDDHYSEFTVTELTSMVDGAQATVERVIESVTYEAAGCGKCVQHDRNPARCSIGRRLVECGGYRDSTAVRTS